MDEDQAAYEQNRRTIETASNLCLFHVNRILTSPLSRSAEKATEQFLKPLGDWAVFGCQHRKQ